MSVNVAEIVLSIQGEGHRSGRRTLFIRTSGCDVGCSWCDTKRLWNSGESTSDEHFSETLSAYFLAASSGQVSNGFSEITITGGEPMMDYANVCTILDILSRVSHSYKYKNFSIWIETSGQYVLPEFREIRADLSYILSPKPHCLESFDFDNLTYHHYRPLHLKFVIASAAVAEAYCKWLHAAARAVANGYRFYTGDIYVQPCAFPYDSDEFYRSEDADRFQGFREGVKVFESCGYKPIVSIQLHKVLGVY